MAKQITVRAVEGLWVVRAGGAVLGETSNALELTEGDYDPVIYVPKADIAMAFLDSSQTTSHCPLKGEASYYSIQTKSVLIKDAGWEYASPLEGVTQIKDHIAFYPDKVAVEQL